MTQDLSGQKLGQYELRERLGRGGMADVYKAFQPGLERFVALKVMLGHLATDQEFIERFRREARAVAQLRHPHIVTVFDFGIERDIYYMVMEFIRGDNLKAHIANHPHGLPMDDALRIASQIADALEYAHRAEMIHRDVKPANIMFTDDTLRHAILTDFGIAHILSQPGLTASGAMIGTPAYLSPEIAAGRGTDERADIYGLGIILYEMLTGRVPYEADTPMAIIMQHVNAPLPSPSEYGRELPEYVEKIILKAMMKNPDERYQTAAEMKAALDSARAQLADAGPVSDIIDRTEPLSRQTPTVRRRSAPEESPTTMVKQPVQRSPLVWVGVGIMGLMIVAAALLLSRGGTPPAVEPTSGTQIAAADVTEEASATSTDIPTETPTDTPTDPPTQTPTDEPSATPTELPTETPTEQPASIAMLPENFESLRESGLLSGLTPLQDQVDSLILNGDVETARQQLDQILTANPENVDALVARALLSIFDGDPDAAAADADRAIELAPDSPLGYIARSDVLQFWSVDDSEGALAAAQQALELDADNPEALWRASYAYSELGNSEGFYDTFNRAESGGAKGFRFIYFAGEYLFYSREYERALPYLELRYAITPDDGYSLQLLVQNLLHLDRAADALAAVKNYPGVMTEPEDLGAAAFVAYKAGDFAQARDWAETALALSDEAYSANYIMGLISWYADNNLDAALSYLNRLNGVEFYDPYLNLEYGHQLDMDRGYILMQAEEYEAAAGEFQRALETVGQYPFVYEALADAQLGLGQTEAARENLRLALDNTYDDPEEQRRLLDRIRTLGAAGSAEAETMPEVVEPPAINPMSGLTPLQDEIDTLLLNGQWDEARVRLVSTLRTDPTNLEVLVASALYFRLVGDFERALHNARQAVRIAPESPLGYIALSDVLLNNGAGEFADALRAAETALELDPGNGQALWRASLAHANLGNWETHVELLNEAIEAGAQGFLFANFAGEYLYYSGDYTRALPYLRAWYSTAPGDIYATAILAANLIQLDQTDEAYTLFQDFPGDFQDAQQYGWAAYVAYRAGEYEQAREWAEGAFTYLPRAPGAHYVLGLVSWYADGNLEEALSHFDIVHNFAVFSDLFLNPDNGHESYYDRGRILVEAGDLEAAIEAFESSLRNDPRVYTYEALADVYLAQGDTDAARLNLEAALEMSWRPEEQERLQARLAELADE